MSTVKSFKSAIIAYTVLIAALIAVVVGVSSSNNFNYDYRPAVERAGYETAPEVHSYHISPSLAWEATNDGAAAWFKAIAVIILAGYGVFIFFASAGRFNLPKSTFNLASWAILAVALACLFGAYAGTYANNWVTIFGDNSSITPHNIEELFRSKELIK